MSRALRDNLRAYAFVSPWIISLLVFTAYPLLASFYFAMTRYTIVKPAEWIGFDNFVVMFTKDDLFWVAVWNTLYYTLISVPLQMAVALWLATMLNQSTRGIGFYRTAFYLPSLVPAVVTTLLWMLILDPRAGLANAALQAVGLPKLGWMYSAAWAKPSLIIISLWVGVGQPMLIFLAGLKEVPKSLLEAATIDGANNWQRYWRVIIPLLTPTIFFNLV
ncbi:MAG: sugar ABC transporter permease, partial [Caldilinea sp.]|nr:sugar ABC transporter permease [Caldilinea sp.]